MLDVNCIQTRGRSNGVGTIHGGLCIIRSLTRGEYQYGLGDDRARFISDLAENGYGPASRLRLKRRIRNGSNNNRRAHQNRCSQQTQCHDEESCRSAHVAVSSSHARLSHGKRVTQGDAANILCNRPCRLTCSRGDTHSLILFDVCANLNHDRKRRELRWRAS